MSTVYNPTTRTAEEWKAEARASRQRSADSFARCDTDGFLSQGASDAMANLYDTCATVAENGGMDVFCGVGDLDGNLLPAKNISGRYGPSWRVETPEGVVWFTESSARSGERRRAAHAKKGFTLLQYRAKALVAMGSGWGNYIFPARESTPEVIGEWPYSDY